MRKLLKNKNFYLLLSLLFLIILYFSSIDSKWFFIVYFVYLIPYCLLDLFDYLERKKRSSRHK